MSESFTKPEGDVLAIRPYVPADENAVKRLWQACGLLVPWNDPERDIRRKLDHDPAGFLVAEVDGDLVAVVMAGYDGHRGWLNYLAVDPDHRGAGYGRRMVAAAEALLLTRGCPKVNLQVRASNTAVVEFYRRLGYRVDAALSLGRRLIEDESSGRPLKDTRKDIDIRHAAPDPESYIALRRRVGMSACTPRAAALALPRSVFAVSLYRDTQLVGMGRVVGDGGCYFQIVDVAVDPSFRGLGFGRLVMRTIMDYLDDAALPGCEITLSSDTAEFFESLGFRHRDARTLYWPHTPNTEATTP